MAVRIAIGREGVGFTFVIDAEESLLLAGCFDRVERDGESAVCAVFKAEGHGESGCHLAVCLAFGGACADCGPANEVGDVLWCDRVEQLGGGWHAEVDHFLEEAAGDAEAFGDVARAVEVGIHDEPLPADSGAWLLEIDAHDEEHAVFDLFCECGELVRIFAACFQIVDRAGADYDEESTVVTEDDFVNGFATLSDEFACGFRFFDLFAKCEWRW